MNNNNNQKLLALFLAMIIMMSFPMASIFKVNSHAEAPITASQFATLMNVGWNLGNSLDSHYGEPDGTANLSQETIWGQPKNSQAIIDYVKAQGFNTIRIPVSWYYHTYRDEKGSLRVHPDWLKRVKEVVNYALNDGLFVIMNSHHDGPIFHAGISNKDLETVTADVTSIWTDIAVYFADCDSKLIFEAFNEVDNWEKYWQFGKKAGSQMNELNQTFVNTVRGTGGNNAQRILMVPTLLDKWGDKFLAAFKLPADTVSDRLLVTVHYYPSQFDQSIETTFSSLQAFSKKIGTPVIIGEWGTEKGYSPASYRTIHAANFVAKATAHGLRCIYWDNGSSYAIIDRKNLTCDAAMISAIMHPSAYTSEESEQLGSWSDYLYMTINQETGQLKEDNHWGTLLVSKDGSGWYPIPSGKTVMSVSLVKGDGMESQALHYVYFFDANGNLLSKINEWNGFTDKVAELPAGSAYVRIGLNSAQSATSKSDYKKAVESGKLRVVMRFN